MNRHVLLFLFPSLCYLHWMKLCQPLGWYECHFNDSLKFLDQENDRMDSSDWRSVLWVRFERQPTGILHCLPIHRTWQTAPHNNKKPKRFRKRSKKWLEYPLWSPRNLMIDHSIIQSLEISAKYCVAKTRIKNLRGKNCERISKEKKQILKKEKNTKKAKIEKKKKICFGKSLIIILHTPNPFRMLLRRDIICSQSIQTGFT